MQIASFHRVLALLCAISPCACTYNVRSAPVNAPPQAAKPEAATVPDTRPASGTKKDCRVHETRTTVTETETTRPQMSEAVRRKIDELERSRLEIETQRRILQQSPMFSGRGRYSR